MRKSSNKNYYIVEWDTSTLRLDQLWKRFPEIVEGKYLVNISWDSGKLKPTEDEVKEGWKVKGENAHSPLIKKWENIPSDQYDEWYAFDSDVDQVKVDALVNYLTFSPIDFGWKEKLDLFWNQIEKYKPVSSFGDGSKTFIVTRDESLKSKLKLLKK